MFCSDEIHTCHVRQHIILNLVHTDLNTENLEFSELLHPLHGGDLVLAKVQFLAILDSMQVLIIHQTLRSVSTSKFSIFLILLSPSSSI